MAAETPLEAFGRTQRNTERYVGSNVILPEATEILRVINSMTRSCVCLLNRVQVASDANEHNRCSYRCTKRERCNLSYDIVVRSKSVKISTRGALVSRCSSMAKLDLPNRS